jgi:hypothetical protein
MSPKQKDMDRLYAIIDSAAEGRYQELFQMLGEKQAKNGNFHCWNPGGHSDGEDTNASLSVNNSTGQWKCHGCSITGNFNTYYKKYIAGSPSDKWDGHYTQFMCEVLGLNAYLPDTEQDEKLVKQAVEISKHFDEILSKKKTKPSGEPKKEVPTISQDDNDKYVETLLKMDKPKALLLEKRGITDDIIMKYRIGFSAKDGAITFPMIDAKGQILNLKLYRPWNEKFKWQAKLAGLTQSFIPTPVSHLTHTKLYIFEGEPDCYCAAAHGFYGITCGSASNKSFKKFYGDQFEINFRNKEIVFVMDADEAGTTAATDLAKELYGLTKQIKIINLNKSEINPHGLDPTLMKDVNGKQKRQQKDFTEFMQLNGLGEKAIRAFSELEKLTPVYTQNTSRSKTEKFKVSITEAVNSRYYDKDSLKHLEVMASIREFDQKVYKYPTKICVSCRPLFDINFKNNCCKKCKIATLNGYGDQTLNSISFSLIRMADPASRDLKKGDIAVREYDILSLIQTTDEKLMKAKKKIIDIPEACKDVKFVDEEIHSLQHVSLVKDPDDVLEDSSKQSMRDKGSKTDFVVDGFFLGERIATSERIDVNKSYRLNSTQTLIPGKQNVALFCHDVQGTEESFDTFQMDDDTYEMLTVFKPTEGQSIKDHLDDRYKIFGNAAGVNGRDDLFFLCDLAYFSTTELKNDQVLPSIKRGWVEVLIAGDPRCGKSIVGEFLYNHYRFGDFIGGSDAITRTGLVGGIVTSFGTRKIQWGKFPQNDRGIVIIDELSRVDHDGLNSITDLRSSGYAQIEKITSGQIPARVRKICFSNWRGWRDEDVDHSAYGIENLRKLCFEDPILARFDVATVIKAGDVKKFDCKYERISTKFTSFQCRTLINWAYSRKPEQIKFEDGMAELLNKAQDQLLQKYHPTTQLINQEMRAKICRMAISLATMTFSTDPEDWNVIYVKLEHAGYIVDFLDKLYSHKNMGMIEFSNEKRRTEVLGDMRFMMNILKFIDLDAVLSFKEGTERDLCQIFSDYLLKVGKYEVFIVDGKSDEVRTAGWNAVQLNDKFIGLLRARNCIGKTTFGRYRKTEVFTEWLKKRKELGDSAETSDILESSSAKQDTPKRYLPTDFISGNKGSKRKSAD